MRCGDCDIKYMQLHFNHWMLHCGVDSAIVGTVHDCHCNDLRVSRLTSQIQEGGTNLVVGRGLLEEVYGRMIEIHGFKGFQCRDCAIPNPQPSPLDEPIKHDKNCPAGRLRALLDGKGEGEG